MQALLGSAVLFGELTVGTSLSVNLRSLLSSGTRTQCRPSGTSVELKEKQEEQDEEAEIGGDLLPE